MNHLSRFIKDIINHRDLIRYLTIADFKANSARTYFGLVWWIVDPLLYMLIFYLLVQVILQRGGEDYAVFLFVALIPLKWTISCIVDGTNSITSKKGIIEQIYVPKTVLILVRFLINTIKFFIGVAVLLAFLFVYGIEFTPYMFYFIPIMMIHLVFLIAVMIILAHVGVYLRDIRNMMQYIARTLFYLSPVMYELSRVPEHLQTWLYLNPLTSLITGYRNAMLYAEPINWQPLLILLGASILLLFFSLSVLYKYEKTYAKVM
ncbi:ABC transporter permease [Alkalihalophilus marmarensis]|uniref:ABC transporter permease n=1 Tax=Alkalihalophilus marmarensis TaxID=521377 RepID=UPI002E1DD665|nr:ABC transporter permease [Alkalihalophilus marmarensis]